MKKVLYLQMTMFSSFLWSIFFTACGGPQDQNSEIWVPVQVHDSASTLKEIGILEAKELTRIQNLVDGTISEIMEDGSRVKKGQRVLRLDDEELRNNLDNELQNLEQVKEDLENELAEYAVLTNSFEMTSKLKRAELDFARLELKHGIVPLTPEDRRLREIEIELAKLDLEDKTSQFAREEELVEKGFAPATTLETARREMEASEIFLTEKKMQLSLAGQPVPDEERLTMETAVKNAEDAVKRNQQKQDRDLEIQDLKIEGLRLKVAHTQDKIDLIRGRLNIVELFAPTGGILRLTQEWVWSINAWIPLSTGQRVRGLDMIGTVVDPNDLSLRIIVHESDYLRLQIGQRVQARLTAFPRQEFSGIISSMTELGQDRNDLSPIFRQAPAIMQAMFLVHVTLDGLSDKAIPGMTATAIIELEPKKNRFIIPSESVRETNEDRFYVTLRRDGDVRKQAPVQGFFTDEGTFEVRQGLQNGDEVLINGGKE